MSSEKNKAIIAQIKAKALQDEEFKKALAADPIGVLKKAGVAIEDEVKTIKVVENTPATRYLVLPLVNGGKLSDDALSGMAAGAGAATTVDTMDVVVVVSETQQTAQIVLEAGVEIVVTGGPVEAIVQCAGTSDK